eukprot:scaffold323410_cov41-Prasinocladus_malaysianus.AAC.1
MQRCLEVDVALVDVVSLANQPAHGVHLAAEGRFLQGCRREWRPVEVGRLERLVLLETAGRHRQRPVLFDLFAAAEGAPALEQPPHVHLHVPRRRPLVAGPLGGHRLRHGLGEHQRGLLLAPPDIGDRVGLL